MAGIETDDKNIDECGVCMEKYDQREHQPKLLSCHHSYCLTCVNRLSNRRGSVECPNCRRVTQLPQGGATNLQYNWYVDEMRRLALTDSENVCPKHSKPIELFCEVCKVMICSRCLAADHNGHKVVHEDDLRAKMQDHHEEIRRKREKVLSTITKRKQNIISLEGEKQRLNAEMTQNLVYIDQTFAAIRDALAKKQQSMKQYVKTKYEASVTDIVENTDNETFKIASFENLISLLDQAVSCTRPIAVAQAANNPEIDRQLTEFLKVTQTLPPDGNTEQIQKDLPVILQGLQCAVEQLVPTTTAALVQVIKTKPSVAIAGIATTVEFHTNVKSSGLSVTIIDPENDVISNVIEMTSDTSYRVKYTPQVVGVHKCAVTYFDLGVGGGEFNIAVKSNNPVMKIGSQGTAVGQLKAPISIDLDAAGNMYVSDRNNQRIQKFDKRGQYVTHWSVGGRDNKGYPGFLAVNKVTNDVIYTRLNKNEGIEGDPFQYTNILQIYNNNNKMMGEITVEEDMQIYGIAVNSQQQIMCTDFFKHTMILLSKDFAVLKKISCRGAEPGQFFTPTGVAAGLNDDIIVMDRGNNRVQVFDVNCVFQYQFGSEGTKKGEFKALECVNIDKDGHILVSDTERGDIQVFDYSGQFLSCINSGDDKMNLPLGLAATDDLHVLVADRNNHCIKKYKYM